MRGIGRILAAGMAVLLIAGACGGAGAPSAATATGAATATAAALPKFELSHYTYSLQTKGKIRIGTQEDNTPFSVKNPTTGKWEGFDVDIGREMAKAIWGTKDDPDTHIEWVPVTSATRIPTLQENKADVIIKTFTINAERKTQIDFSDVYFQTGQRILVKKTNTAIKEVADLAGKNVCSQRGSTSEKNISQATNNQAKLVLLDSYPACLLALQQGTADAVSTDETILFGLVKQDPTTQIVGKYFSEEPYGIGVKKDTGDRVGFVAFLNTFVANIIKDGTWGKIYEKHISPVSGDKKQAPK